MAEQFLHGVETVEIENGARPIRTVKSSIQGFVGTATNTDASAFPFNKPVLVKTRALAEKLGPGTLRDSYRAAADQGATLSVMVRVPESGDPLEQLAHVHGDPAAMSGVYALRASGSELGVTPRILSAPSFTGLRPDGNANPIGAALKGIAKRERAVAIVDGPNTTEAEALAARNDYGSDRVYMVDPFVKAFRDGEYVDLPASAFASAAMARRDVEKGFWWSASNSLLGGVTGLARPVPFGLSDPDSEANRLNENGIATVINHQGFRLWGQRSTATDPLWAFLQVRRTADMIYESIEAGHLWAMDRPISRQIAKDILESVNAYLRRLIAVGAILGGRAWLDEELNEPAVLKAGKLYVNFDIEPPAGLEHLIFQAFRNDGYYEEVLLDLAA